MREREMTGFQGIFLDETSKKRLIALQEKKLKYIVRDMHITFKFGDIVFWLLLTFIVEL